MHKLPALIGMAGQNLQNTLGETRLPEDGLEFRGGERVSARPASE